MFYYLGTSLKQTGDNFFNQQQYVEALKCYSEAVQSLSDKAASGREEDHTNILFELAHALTDKCWVHAKQLSVIDYNNSVSKCYESLRNAFQYNYYQAQAIVTYQLTDQSQKDLNDKLFQANIEFWSQILVLHWNRAASIFNTTKILKQSIQNPDNTASDIILTDLINLLEKAMEHFKLSEHCQTQLNKMGLSERVQEETKFTELKYNLYKEFSELYLELAKDEGKTNALPEYVSKAFLQEAVRLNREAWTLAIKREVDAEIKAVEENYKKIFNAQKGFDRIASLIQASIFVDKSSPSNQTPVKDVAGDNAFNFS